MAQNRLNRHQTKSISFFTRKNVQFISSFSKHSISFQNQTNIRFTNNSAHYSSLFIIHYSLFIIQHIIRTECHCKCFSFPTNTAFNLLFSYFQLISSVFFHSLFIHCSYFFKQNLVSVKKVEISNVIGKDWFEDWLIGWLIDSKIGQLIDWLIDWMNESFQPCFFHLKWQNASEKGHSLASTEYAMISQGSISIVERMLIRRRLMMRTSKLDKRHRASLTFPTISRVLSPMEMSAPNTMAAIRKDCAANSIRLGVTAVGARCVMFSVFQGKSENSSIFWSIFSTWK